MKRFWICWHQPTEDERPLTFPPNAAILGWWCTGYGYGYEQEDLPIIPVICALVEADTLPAALKAIKKDWPEAELNGSDDWDAEVEANWLPPKDRFPPSDWMSERMG